MKFFLKLLFFLKYQKTYLYLKFELDYSYFKALIGSSFAAFNAGNIETIIVIKIEHKEIMNIENGFISDGIELKK
jgi:hypothetical protein